MINTSEIIVDLYNQNVTVECYKLKYIGIYGICLFISSLAANVLYIWIYAKTKVLHTPINFLLLSLTILSLIGTVLEVPLVIYSAFICKFTFGKVGCYVNGFIMYFVGCMSIYLLMAISIERYSINSTTNITKALTYNQCYKIISFCALMSLFWSSMPLMGWSYYSLEGAMITCSVEWHSREARVVSYNISIFIFVFLIPFILLIVTNIKLILAVGIIRSTERKFKRRPLSCMYLQKRFEINRDVSSMVISLIICFVISWCPYAIICMYRALYDAVSIPPMVATLPAYFAKSSLLWPSLLNILTNKTVRNSLPLKYKRLRTSNIEAR